MFFDPYMFDAKAVFETNTFDKENWFDYAT